MIGYVLGGFVILVMTLFFICLLYLNRGDPAPDSECPYDKKESHE